MNQTIMNKKELMRKLHHLHAISLWLGMVVFWLLLSPVIIVALCATRRFDMSLINQYGILWAVCCVILAISSAGRGIYLYIKEKPNLERELYLSTEAFSYMEEYIKGRLSRLIGHIITGFVICLFSVFPIITVTSIRTANAVLIESCYYLIFGFIAIGILVIASSGIYYYITGILAFHQAAKDLPVLEKRTFIHRIGSTIKRHKKLSIFFSILLICFILIRIMGNGTWYLQPYISTIPMIEVEHNSILYDEDTGIYSIQMNEDEDFKILQLTDIHLGGSALSYSKDLKALEAVYDLISYTKPNLVIVTGDFVFPLGIESYSFNNYTPIMQFASFMRNMGITWAFTYGNHDTEFLATHSEDELNELFAQFSYGSTKSLLYTAHQPDITGRCNQILLIKNADDSINQALYLIDSNSYASGKINDYDYIHDDQVDWYENSVKELSKEQGETISSLIFTHIPLQEYQTAYDLYKTGSSDVTYYFGEIGESKEAISCSDYPSQLFDKVVELQSTKGIFVGHDHYNTLSLDYQNVRLTFGMSIDYLAMPGIANKTEQRGGTLITLHPDSTFDVEQIPLTSIR